MLWSDLQGHERPQRWLRHAINRGRLASTFLFVGRDGIGKRTFARIFAKTLLCRKSDPKNMSPCGVCEDCVQVDASTHPDLMQVAKPVDKAELPTKLLIGEGESRMREGLCHDIRLRPYYGRRKVAIIDDADSLNEEGANCLLKTLEEPPRDSILILISQGEHRQLPTIRSRCQIVRFLPLSAEQAEAALLNRKLITDPGLARELSRCCEGSISYALRLENAELRDFRTQLYRRLAAASLDMPELAKGIGALAEKVGKDSGAAKRERIRIVLGFAEQFYRQVIIALHGGKDCDDALLGELAGEKARNFRGGLQGAIQAWHRTLKAIEELDRFVNQTTLLEAWSIDIAAATRS